MPSRKYRVTYRIPFGAVHSTVVDARTSNEAKTIFRKNHGRDVQGNLDKILSVTLIKEKKEQGGMMAKGGETKFISLTTRKGQSEVEKYTNQGWGIKFQNDKFAILERGGKKKN